MNSNTSSFRFLLTVLFGGLFFLTAACGYSQKWHSLSVSGCAQDTFYVVVPHGPDSNESVLLFGTDYNGCDNQKVMVMEGDGEYGGVISSSHHFFAGTRVYGAPFSHSIYAGNSSSYNGLAFQFRQADQSGIGFNANYLLDTTKTPRDLFCFTDGEEQKCFVVGKMDSVFISVADLDSSNQSSYFQNTSLTFFPGQVMPEDLYGIWFPTPDTGYVAGANGLIMKTVDTGKTWFAQNSGVTEKLNHICFPTSDTGYAIGEDGTILRTLDGGANWEQKNAGTNADLNAIVCPTRDKCMICGDSGKILHSCNTGELWEEMPTPTTEELFDIDCEPYSDSCFAVGAGGTFLRLKNGTHVSCQQVVGEEERERKDDALSWNQNRTAKELRVMSSKRKALRIRLIDVTGKVVLDQERMITAGGEHRFSYNSLAGGAYVLSISEEGTLLVSEPVMIGR